jgi:pSer/pThr/pTyr-binding forkhead associated (FHA) protein
VLAKAKILRDGVLLKTVPLEAERTVFGRGAHGPARLEDMTASRDHLLVTRYGDALIASDLGSRHGTLLNGAPLMQPTRLQDGDVLILGRTDVKITLDHGGTTTAPLKPRAPVLKLPPDEVEILKALVAPLRDPRAVAAAPASNKAIAKATGIAPRTLTRRLDQLAAKLRVQPSTGRGRSLALARRTMEWGLDGQRSAAISVSAPADDKGEVPPAAPTAGR